jgi:ribosomal protein S2
MARTKGVNKSQSIRDYLEANPKSRAKEVVAGLAASGLEVSENLVYGIMGGVKEKKKRVARAARAAVSEPSGNGQASKTDAITLIREVKALAHKAGGYEKLKELVDALAE